MIRIQTNFTDVRPETFLPTAFEVTVITPGKANGYFYPASVLEAAAPKFIGASVFVNHPDALDRTRPGERRVEDLAGVLEEAHWEGDAVRGRMRRFGPKAEMVAALASQIISDRAKGLPVPDIGLSADMLVRADGRGVVQEIGEVISVDVVFRPARGGAFERVLNAIRRNEPQKSPFYLALEASLEILSLIQSLQAYLKSRKTRNHGK